MFSGLVNGLKNFAGGVVHGVESIFHPQAPQQQAPPPPPSYNLGQFLAQHLGNGALNPSGEVLHDLNALRNVTISLPHTPVTVGQVAQQLPKATLQAPVKIAQAGYNSIVKPIAQNAFDVGKELYVANPISGAYKTDTNSINSQLNTINGIEDNYHQLYAQGKLNKNQYFKLLQGTQAQRQALVGQLNANTKALPTPQKAASDVGQLGVNILSAGAGSSEANAGEQVAHPFLRAVAQGAAPNAAYGAVQGGLQAFGQGKKTGDIAKEAASQAASNALFGAVLGGLGYGVSKAMTPEAVKTLTNESGKVKLPGGTEDQPIERGFIKTIKGSPTTSPQLKAAVEGTYPAPRNTADLQAQAQNFIKQDIAAARNHALTGTDDSAVATAIELIKKYQNEGDYQSATELANQTAKNLTEHGRAVQAATVYNNISPEGIVRHTSSLIKKAGGEGLPPDAAKSLVEQAKAVQAMPEGRDKLIAQGKLQQAIAAQIPSSNTDKAIAIWKSGLLTGPKTISKIAISNPLMTTMENIKDIPAAAVDKIASLFTGERTTVAPNLENLGYGAQGAGQGLQDAGTYLKTGVKLPNSSGFGTGELQGHANFKNPVLQAYTQVPGRIHGSITMPFYEGRFNQSLAQQAEAQALTQGLKGAEKTSFVKEFVAHPSPDALDAAAKDAQYATLQQKTAIGQAASGFQQKLGPLGQVIAPFTRIPGAVATDLIDYSPAGAAKTVIQNIGKGKFNQRDLAQGLGRAATGTAVAAIGAALMNAGRMTGAFPTDPKEQALWQREGKQPNSILVGNKWQSIGSLGPAAQALLAGGQYAAGTQQKGLVGGVQQGAAGALRAITDQPYLTGVSGALNAINTPTQAQSFYDQTAGSIVPTGLAQVAKATDPLQRQTSVGGPNGPIQSVKNAITNRIPGLREKNLPVQDIFGNNQPREGGVLTNLLNPLNPTQAKGTDAVTQEIQRLFNVPDVNGKPTGGVSQVPKTLSVKVNGQTVKVSPQDRSTFIAQSGPQIYSAVNQLIQTPQYQALDDAGKAKAIDNIVSAYRGAQKVSQLGANPKTLTTGEKAVLNGGSYNGLKTPKVAKAPKAKATKGTSTRSTRSTRSAKVAKVPLPKFKAVRLSTPRVARLAKPKRPTYARIGGTKKSSKKLTVIV